MIWHLQNFISIFSKGRNFTRGDNSKKKNMCLLFFHEESIHEVSRRYLIPEYHSCKISGSKILKKGNNSKNIYDFFFQFFDKYSIYHPLSADTSFKFLAIILFEIRIDKISYPCLSKGRNLTRGDNSVKPEICVGYFSMRNPYMKFQDDISNMNTYIHTYGQAETNMSPLFQKLTKNGK